MQIASIQKLSPGVLFSRKKESASKRLLEIICRWPLIQITFLAVSVSVSHSLGFGVFWNIPRPKTPSFSLMCFVFSKCKIAPCMVEPFQEERRPWNTRADLVDVCYQGEGDECIICWANRDNRIHFLVVVPIQR